MPAFVANGPDIPERLLQEHEDGRVVFFCGAGISFPAGLPSFDGLVKAVYLNFGGPQNEVQQAAIKAKQFDTAIGLLEDDIGDRKVVRDAILRILTPKTITSKVLETHEALLTLSQNRDGRRRLITTNFDRLFEEVIARKKLVFESFKAPLLPIPKNRWDGLVYLHGLLPSEPNTSEFDRLVVSSGDFGLAYLSERWAARFLSELFRNYIVCFVGYSINDPVLRYMMDALAADRLLGESPREMFAFGSYPKGKEEQAFKEWKAKTVTPILYRKYKGHEYLHKTLREWAKTYRDGVQGKKMIIAQHASTPPLAPTRSDFAVGRVLWALTDKSAAKHFAELNPVPPIEWLEPLSEPQFKHDDLSRFGVVPEREKNDELAFSFICRPSPYLLSSFMHISDRGYRNDRWDGVMFQIASWLTRHLDDSKLILWLANQGGQLHPFFMDLVKSKIEELDELERSGENKKFNHVKNKSLKGIPSLQMRTLWDLFLSGRIKKKNHTLDIYDWFRHFKHSGLTPVLRMELREFLSPKVNISAPIPWPELGISEESDSIKKLVDWNIELSSDDMHTALENWSRKPEWHEVLPNLLNDFTSSLHDVLDLMQGLDGAGEKSDLSYIHQPSISEHPQNKAFRDWTILIELARDAWIATAQTNRTKARLAAENWWQISFPLFKRLVFFASTYDDVVEKRQALEWLLTDEQWWLWSLETEREAIRLIVALSSKWNVKEMGKLEQAILLGPPRSMYREDIKPERWERIIDREIWLRLAKIQNAGGLLSNGAANKLAKLIDKYPKWRLAENESDEFPFWMGMGMEDEEWRQFVRVPRRRRKLVEYLKESSQSDSWREDDWNELCREKFSTTACALYSLAKEGKWPVKPWKEALHVWKEGKLGTKSWRYLAQLIYIMPDNIIQELSNPLGWWLQAQANNFQGQDEVFLGLAKKILDLEYELEEDPKKDDLVFESINHPIGLVTEALLDWWYRQEPKDGQGLTEDLKNIFTMLCDTSIPKNIRGRLILTGHAISLFRVDKEWTSTYLLPLFDWTISKIEARGAWKGFLWSPRIYRPLLSAIKRPLLETSTHFTSLGEHARQYASFLTFLALDSANDFSNRELGNATRTLPKEGLESVVRTLVRALEGSDEQREEYWSNRILPYLRNIWPKSRDLNTPTISESFGRLCIAAGGGFPEAFNELQNWLKLIHGPDFLIHLLFEAKLHEHFPEETLGFLNLIISDDAQFLPEELIQCLNEIKSSSEELSGDARLDRLYSLYERHGKSG
ncbi:MAG TPA: SIR2 family protein [Thermovirgaceae bacterium]|nr:SIR2 family protein [Thermovirgaceae bacterium]